MVVAITAVTGFWLLYSRERKPAVPLHIPVARPTTPLTLDRQPEKPPPAAAVVIPARVESPKKSAPADPDGLKRKPSEPRYVIPEKVGDGMIDVAW